MIQLNKLDHTQIPRIYMPIVRGIEILQDTDINSLIIKSKTGLGKSYYVDYTLDKIGVNYVLFKGSVSEARFFKFVQDNSDKLICYDNQTEILTENGWKFFKDVNKEDKVATLNEDTEHLEFNKPYEMIIEDYKGEMIGIKNRNIDLLVTPNHKLYVKTSTKNSKFRFVKALESYNKKDWTLKKNCKWKGNDIDGIILDAIYPKHHIIKPERKINMDSWLKFLGIYLSEGHTKCRYVNPTSVQIAQKIGIKSKMIEEAFKECGFKYTSKLRKDNIVLFEIHDNQLANHTFRYGKHNYKYIPKELKGLPSEKLKILLQYLMLGDGHSENGKYIYYSSTSKRLIDDIQEIALKIGIPTNIRKRKPQNIKWKPYYLIFFNQSITPVTKNGWYKKDYNGKVYCVEVKNHLIYVRRDGKPYWCGNCMRDCGSMLRKVTFLDFLKSATDPVKHRKISRLNYAKHEGVEENVDFTGKIIWEINELPKKNKEDLSAVIERSLVVELNPSRDEISKIMYLICKDDFDIEVTSYLLSNSHKLGRNSFNLRIQNRVLTIAKSSIKDNLDWKKQLDLFINTQESEIKKALYRLSGLKPVRRIIFIKYLMQEFDISWASSHKKLDEALLLNELYSNEKRKQSLICLIPFTEIKNI